MTMSKNDLFIFHPLLSFIFEADAYIGLLPSICSSIDCCSFSQNLMFHTYPSPYATSLVIHQMMGLSVYPFAIPYVYGSRLSEMIPSRAMPGHAKPDHAGYVHVDSINLYSLFNPVLK